MSHSGERGQEGPPGLIYPPAGYILTFLIRTDDELRTATRFVPIDFVEKVLKFMNLKTSLVGNGSALPILEPGEYEQFYHDIIHGTTVRKFNLIKQIKTLLKEIAI